MYRDRRNGAELVLAFYFTRGPRCCASSLAQLNTVHVDYSTYLTFTRSPLAVMIKLILHVCLGAAPPTPAPQQPGMQSLAFPSAEMNAHGYYQVRERSSICFLTENETGTDPCGDLGGQGASGRGGVRAVHELRLQSPYWLARRYLQQAQPRRRQGEREACTHSYNTNNARRPGPISQWSQ